MPDGQLRKTSLEMQPSTRPETGWQIFSPSKAGLSSYAALNSSALVSAKADKSRNEEFSYKRT